MPLHYKTNDLLILCVTWDKTLPLIYFASSVNGTIFVEPSTIVWEGWWIHLHLITTTYSCTAFNFLWDEYFAKQTVGVTIDYIIVLFAKFQLHCRSEDSIYEVLNIVTEYHQEIWTYNSRWNLLSPNGWLR